MNEILIMTFFALQLQIYNNNNKKSAKERKEEDKDQRKLIHFHILYMNVRERRNKIKYDKTKTNHKNVRPCTQYFASF